MEPYAEHMMALQSRYDKLSKGYDALRTEVRDLQKDKMSAEPAILQRMRDNEAVATSFDESGNRFLRSHHPELEKRRWITPKPECLKYLTRNRKIIYVLTQPVAIPIDGTPLYRCPFREKDEVGGRSCTVAGFRSYQAYLKHLAEGHPHKPAAIHILDSAGYYLTGIPRVAECRPYVGLRDLQGNPCFIKVSPGSHL